MNRKRITLIVSALTISWIVAAQNFTTDITVTSDGGAEMNLLNTSSNVKWQVVSGYNGGLEIGNVTGGMTDTNAPFFIDQNGKIGIGVTYPTERFHVRNGNIKFEFDSQFGKDPILTFENEGTNADIWQTFYRWSGNTDLYWATRFERAANVGFKIQMANTATLGNHSFIDALTIDNAGFLGIGTSDPSEKLHIEGTTQINHFKGEGIKFSYSGASSGDGQSIGSNSNGDLILSAHFALSGNEHLIIQQNTGNVGIGVVNPDSKLVVDGKIRSEEVKVEVINAPDYVFEGDYKLRTLQETKEYVAENKHLPEIPSAREMEANGIDLGDMNMRLLKKIEELTLYQIQLLERIEKLETENTRINELEKKLQELAK